ncbi:MAG TPA: hypothetical protein V6C76_05850 [Drouetiella sp.]
MWRKLLVQTLLLTAFSFPTASFANAKFDTNSTTPNFLVIYFHSYGGDYLEAFEKPSKSDSIAKAFMKDIPGVAVMTVDRDPAASLNGSDGYRVVTQLILQSYDKYPSLKHIILSGTSLGAYESVVYPFYAPANILEKIHGIISVEPTDDVAELYWKTGSPRVRELLNVAFHGSPKQEPDYYRTHSVKTIWSHMPDRPQTKVCIVSAKRDKVVPPMQQKRLATTLREKKMNVRLVEIDRTHSVADAVTYGDALHFVTGR